MDPHLVDSLPDLPEAPERFRLETLLAPGELQTLQDEFASATDVASLIVDPSGRPLTRPSNFRRLCSELIPSVSTLAAEWAVADAQLLAGCGAGLVIQRRLADGLLDAAAPITVDGRLLGAWLVGQVRNPEVGLEKVREHAAAHGADPEAFVGAYQEIPIVPMARFEAIARSLTALARQLSTMALQILQQDRTIGELRSAKTDRELSQRKLEEAQARARLANWELDSTTNLITGSPELFRLFARDPARGAMSLEDFLEWVHPEDRAAIEAADDRVRAKGEAVMLDFRSHPDRGPVRCFNLSVHGVHPVNGSLHRFSGTVQDITERKQTEEALLASEERYRLLAEHVSDVIWQADLDTLRFTYVSPSVERLLGYRVEEIAAGSVLDTVTPRTAEYLTRVLRTRVGRFRQGEDVSYTDEFEQRCKDGTTVWTETVTRLRENPRTGRLEVYGISRNVSARRRAEENLRRTQRDLERAQAVGQVGSWSHHLGDDTLHWSPQTCRIFGSAPDALAGSADRFWRSVHAEDLGLVEERVRAALTGEQSYEIEHRILRPDGKIRWVREQAEVERDLDGRPIRLVGIVQDITERRQAELTLRESEERFRQTVESAPDAIFVNVDQRFAYVNRAAVRVFGAHSAEQLVGQPVLERFDPAFHAEILARTRRLLKDRATVPLAAERCLKLDGTGFDAEVSAVPFVFHGAPAALVFLRDVSERRKLEEQLRMAQKMEAVGQLAGGVAHDFNNILAAQLLQISLMLEQPGLDPAMRLNLTELRRCSDRAAELVRQLLLFSRRSPIQPRLLDLNSVVELLLSMLRRLLGEHILVEWHPAPDTPWFDGDAGMIDQVIVNLCVNARDAMARGGRLQISACVRQVPAPRAETYGARGGRYAVLTVADNGCGMDEATRRRIFEPFFTTKDVGRGTGLGLATVHGIVQHHQGWVEVDSTPGLGSEFRVYLPASNAPSQRPEIPREPAVPRGSETILVVEDEPAVRTAITRSLERSGYEVLGAGSARSALEVWEKDRDRIALLFTDIIMPDGMHGVDLIEHVLRHRPGLPVIACSGYGAEVLAADGAGLPPGVILLPKPFDFGELSRTVRACLDRVAAPR